jgi:hypothetical protein
MRGPGIALGAALLFLGLMHADPGAGERSDQKASEPSVLIVIPVDYPGQIHGALVLAESLRTFGGELAELCQEGPHNVFLHQAALAGVALALLTEKETVEIPESYSYPLLFEKFHGGLLTFDSLEDVVTMRYEFQVADLPVGWEKGVKASPEVLSWIRKRLEAAD